jgi:thiol-disulfide isomerase/thioredoxin
MRPLLSLFLLLVALKGPAVGATESGPMPLHEKPPPVPAIAFTDEAGNALTLEDWRARVVLLNIWATWCAPCRAEMPTLDRLQATVGSEQFEVLALSIDRAGVGAVRSFFDEIGIAHLRLFIDKTMKTSRDLGILGLPATLLIGPDSRELGRLLGPAEWDAPEMIAFLERVIADTTGKEQEP